MSRLRRTVAVALTVLCAAAVAPPVLAAPAPTNCTEPGERISPVPWHQELLDPERAWPFTRGGNVVVAVLSTGVDAGHPQFGDRVLPGFDAVAGVGPANTDCVGTGTQVAGLIAAQTTPSVGLVGLAPRSQILPIRVIGDSRDPVDPAVVARGVDVAVQAGAGVVVVAAATYVDRPVLRQAVANAVMRGTIVVAAAGDRGAPDDGNPRPYPASYPDVVGVGAIAITGQRWPGSQFGSYVDLVAPGVEVVTLQRGAGMTVATGTGFAAGLVGGALALARSKRGSSVTPDELVRIMLATTSPAPLDPGYGAGVVNANATVSGQVSERSPVEAPAVAPTFAEESPALARSRRAALLGAGLGAAVVVLVLVLAVTLPRGRRRWWRPSAARPVVREDEPEETGPPVMLFDER
jgi:hypothetical protein